MKLSSFFTRPARPAVGPYHNAARPAVGPYRIAALAAIAVLAGGCVHYVDPGSTNTGGDVAAYTRAETRGAGARLVAKMLASQAFAQHYAAKVSQKGGAVPVLQIAKFRNLSAERKASALDAVREDIQEALAESGRFVFSGDPDACDYILTGVYKDIDDGARVTHRLALTLHDRRLDLDAWSGSDEIAKE